MKKVLLVSALVMTIVASMVSGTLAVYQTTISKVAENSVFAKEFVIEQDGTPEIFTSAVPIAPSENIELLFTVKNYEGSSKTDPGVISEVNMDVQVNIDLTVAATPATKAIAPLTVTVYKGAIADAIFEVGTGTLAAGVGPLTCEFSSIFVENNPDEQLFTVVVEWPADSGYIDAEFAGPDYGTLLKVSVTGIQNTL